MDQSALPDPPAFPDHSVANAHRAAIRSIERIVDDTVPPQDPATARGGILSMVRGGSVLLLTGAGVSTDSGIPDYRGPKGLWRADPEAEKLVTYEYYMGDPEIRRRIGQPAFGAGRPQHPVLEGDLTAGRDGGGRAEHPLRTQGGDHQPHRSHRAGAQGH